MHNFGGRLRTSYSDLKYPFFSSFLSAVFSFWFSGLSLTVLLSIKSGLQPPGSPPSVQSCTVYLRGVHEGKKELVSLLALASHRTEGISRDPFSGTGCSLVGRASGPESSQALLIWDGGGGRGSISRICCIVMVEKGKDPALWLRPPGER